MYKNITEEQYTNSLEILTQTAALATKRDEIAEKDFSFAELNMPSHIWKQALEYFKYFYNNPTYDVINSFRFHTFLFPGNYIGYYIDLGILEEPPYNLKEEFDAATRELPEEYIIDFPEILGEVGYKINDHVVNKDIVANHRLLRRLYLTGVFDCFKTLKKDTTFLEIGAGYGALSLSIKTILDPKLIVIVDLPEALGFAAIYLTITCNYSKSEYVIYNGDNLDKDKLPKIIFCPNYLLASLAKNTDIKFDFVINTGSFGEMSAKQVDFYGDFIKNNLASSGVFYEDNQNTFVSVNDILSKHLKFKYSINVDQINTPFLWFTNEDSQLNLLSYNHFDREAKNPDEDCDEEHPINKWSNLYWRICFALPKIIKKTFFMK